MPLNGHSINVDILKYEELDFVIHPEDSSIEYVVWDAAKSEFRS